jgi:hypothetical protein
MESFPPEGNSFNGNADHHGIDKTFSIIPEPVSANNQTRVTPNAQFNQVDKSLHVHQAMLLPDAGAAERFQNIYPQFMSEVMEGRRREQRARLMRE